MKTRFVRPAPVIPRNPWSAQHIFWIMSHEVQLSPTASFLPLPARRRRFRRSSHSAAPLPQRAGDTLIWPLPGRIGLYGAASLSHRSAVMSRKWGRDRRGRELGRNCRRRILDGGRARRGAGGERSSSRQQRDLRMVSGWAKRWPRTSAMSSCSTGRYVMRARTATRRIHAMQCSSATRSDAHGQAPRIGTDVR